MTIPTIPVGVISRVADRFQQEADSAVAQAGFTAERITELLLSPSGDVQTVGMEISRLGAELAASGKESRILYRAATIAINTPEDLRDYAIEVLSESPDDTWSGRQNDARRIVADRVRVTGKSILSRIERIEREMDR